jgi:hypothetical protein
MAVLRQLPFRACPSRTRWPLAKTANGVFTSLRGSPYGLSKRLFMKGMGGPGENCLRFTSALAATLLNNLQGISILSVTPCTDPLEKCGRVCRHTASLFRTTT